MSNSCFALGSMAKLLIQGGAIPGGETERQFSNTSQRRQFQALAMRLMDPLQGGNQIVGSVARNANGVRTGSKMVVGQIKFQAGPAHLHEWLPRVLFPDTVAPSGTATYVPGLNPTDYYFDCMADLDNAVFQWTNLLVNSLVIESRTRAARDGVEEMFEVTAQVVGADELNSIEHGIEMPASLPSLPTTSPYNPYLHFESKLYLDGDSSTGDILSMDQFRITINNNLRPHFGSYDKPQCWRVTSREISLETGSAKFTGTSLANVLKAHRQGIVGEILMSSGDFSTRFQFPYLRDPYQTPQVGSKDEIPLQAGLLAFETNSAPEMTVINDYTV